MSLQPSDPAAEAFERLRQEVALLRRAVEGLAADAGGTPVDYSPTLAELSDGVTAIGVQLGALGDRPALALTFQQLAQLQQHTAARLIAKPVAELERARVLLAQMVDAPGLHQQVELAKSQARRRGALCLIVGAGAGLLLSPLLVGPLARALPSSWGVPERLAAATLAEPMAAAGQRLLRRAAPSAWDMLELVGSLPDAARMDLQRCLGRSRGSGGPRTCVVRVRGE